MFTAKDIEIESHEELFKFLPILIFCGLVAPFLIAAYKVSFVSKMVGWLD